MSHDGPLSSPPILLSNSLMQTDTVNCNAKLHHFTHSVNYLSEFANRQLEVSYKYMLLAAQFNTFVKDRPGFHAHFKALSDRSWTAGQNIIKYIAKRGGHFKFGRQNMLTEGLFEMNEFAAMATVLDTEKQLFETARKVHEGSSHAKTPENYDPEVAHYMEEEYLEDLAASIRKYSGFANDLKNLYVGSKDISMDNFLFDQYLQKV